MAVARGIFDDVFSKAGAFNAYDTLTLDQLFSLSRKGQLENASVTEYITHSFAELTSPHARTGDDVPYSPLKLRDILGSPLPKIDASEGLEQSMLVRDIICFNSRIKSAWLRKGLDPYYLPSTPVFRRREFNQLQRLAYTFQEVDPQQDEALELAWPCIRKQLHNKPDMPKEGADAETVRAFLNDSGNYAIIGRITALDLSGLALKVIPEEIERFTGLRSLSLNQITESPKDISDMLQRNSFLRA